MATSKTTVQIVMPAMGESVTEGTVLGWLKAVGDTVAARRAARRDLDRQGGRRGALAGRRRSARRSWSRPTRPSRSAQILGEIEAGDAPADPDAGDGAPPSATARPRGASGAGEIVDVPFPEMGESVTEGTVLEWLVQGRATPSPSTRRWSRSPPTRSTPSCPRPWPARSPRSSSSPTRPCRGHRALPHRGGRRRGAHRAAPPDATRRPSREARPRRPPAGNGDDERHPGGRPHGRRARHRRLEASRGTGPRGRVTKADVEHAADGNGGAPAASAPAPPRAPSRSRSAAPRPRWPGSWTRAARSPRPPASARSPSTCSTPAAASSRPPARSFLHPPDRLGDRAGAKDMPVMGNSLRRGRRQAAAGRPRRRSSLGLAVDVRAQGRHAARWSCP